MSIAYDADSGVLTYKTTLAVPVNFFVVTFTIGRPPIMCSATGVNYNFAEGRMMQWEHDSGRGRGVPVMVA